MSALFLPSSAAEALELTGRHPQARLLAGGTDLLVHLRRTPHPSWPPLIGLEKVSEWQAIRDEGGRIALGCGVTFAALADDPLLAVSAPVLQQAARSVGAPAIRNMATLGGNLCSASPAADALPPLVALGAEVELRSLRGTRSLPIERFIVGPGQTALAPGEILTRILLPKSPPFDRQRFDKVGRRESLAIAVVSMAALLRFDSAGCVSQARFAWGSVGPTVIQAPALEALLLGQTLSPALIEQAVQLACAAVRPIDDLRASAAYRRALVGNLLARFLRSGDGQGQG